MLSFNRPLAYISYFSSISLNYDLSEIGTELDRFFEDFLFISFFTGFFTSYIFKSPAKFVLH